MSACAAVVHSKIFFHGSQNQQSRFESLVNLMIDVFQAHPSLEEQLGTVLFSTIGILNHDKAPGEWIRCILETFSHRDLLKTPLGIAVWLEIVLQAPTVKLPKHIWHRFDPLCEKELPLVIKIMKQSTGASVDDRSNANESRNRGARRLSPSVAWAPIIRHLHFKSLKPDKNEIEPDPALQKFEAFWKEAVACQSTQILSR